MTKTIITILIICFCSLNIFSQTQNELFNIADSLLKINKYETAIPYYDKLIAKDKSNEQYYRGRGYAYIGINALDKGGNDYKKAIELNPNCSNCYNNLGRIEANKGNLEKAIALINLAVKKDTANSEAYYLRARIKELKNDKFGALFDYNKAIELKPNNAYYYAVRGKYNMNLGYNAIAIGDIEKAITIDSSNVQVVYIKAQYFINTQDWKKALLTINKCIELDSTNYEYYSSKGTIFDFLENPNKALESYNLSINLDSSQYLTYLNRGIIKYRTEDMDGTCSDFQKSLQLIIKNVANQPTLDYLNRRINDLCNPKNQSYYYQRGIAAYNLNKFQKAVKHYSEGLILFPKSPLTLSFRGNAYKALGKDSLAIEDYKNFLLLKSELTKEVKETQNYQEKGEAMKNYMLGLIATNYSSIAECYSNIKLFKIAITYADSSIVILSKHKEKAHIQEILSNNYNLRGSIYNINQSYENAKKDFLTAISLNSKNEYPHLNMVFSILGKAKIIKYVTMNSGLYISFNNKRMNKMAIPTFDKKKLDDNVLLQALTECNVAIELNKDFALAYLVRAQIKLYLNHTDYCLDAFIAKELGIHDALKQLNIKCN